MKSVMRMLFTLAGFAAFLPFYVITWVIAVLAKARAPEDLKSKRLVWGVTPILNNKYWSHAMKTAGFQSTTYMTGYYGSINKRSDFDLVLSERFRGVHANAKPILAFWESLLKFDVFFISFDGYFLGSTPYWRLEGHFLRKAGKKVVVIPYGADSYVYRHVRSIDLMHGLMMSYPAASRHQGEIARRVEYWCKHADCLIPGIMTPDGFGRWDVITPSPLVVDTGLWMPSSRHSEADGRNGTVYVAHAPNHRGFKGTEFLRAAIDQLQSEGLQVELVLIERMQNDEVRRIFREKVDIVVEQLILGYALTALEGMASALPVVSNLEEKEYTRPFRRWSFLSECPIVSASPESITSELRKLVTNPKLRQELGGAGRVYVEKYHSFAAAQFLFTAVLEYVYGERDSLINLYHPLLGEYLKDQPRVEHPLVDHRLV